jgi:glycerophosphoryl diester phosphodiesterase
MLKIGHRGACGLEPENTLRSFKKAISLGVDMVECDAHLTKDGKVVIIHDYAVDRTTNGKGKVSELALKEIRMLDAGKREKVPTLKEVITLCKNHKCKLNIEVKGVEPAQKVSEMLVKEKMKALAIVSSNHKESLLEAKKKGLKTALIYWATLTNSGQVLFDISHLLMMPITKRLILRKAKEANVDTINLASTLATKSMVKYLHGNKLTVNVWTVNSKKKIEKFRKRNVDGIFCNFPDRF